MLKTSKGWHCHWETINKLNIGEPFTMITNILLCMKELMEDKAFFEHMWSNDEAQYKTVKRSLQLPLVIIMQHLVKAFGHQHIPLLIRDNRIKRQMLTNKLNRQLNPVLADPFRLHVILQAPKIRYPGILLPAEHGKRAPHLKQPCVVVDGIHGGSINPPE